MRELIIPVEEEDIALQRYLNFSYFILKHCNYKMTNEFYLYNGYGFRVNRGVYPFIVNMIRKNDDDDEETVWKFPVPKSWLSYSIRANDIDEQHMISDFNEFVEDYSEVDF